MSSISKKALCCVVVLCSSALSGCGFQDELDKTRAEFAKQMAETRQTVMKMSTDFTTALPGGQYNLLIRDLNGDDKEAKIRAQNFLRSLGHLEDLDRNLEASVWFGFDTSNVSCTTPGKASCLKVDAFRAPTPSIAEVQQRYTFKAGNLRPVGNTMSVPQSAEQLKRDIHANIQKMGTYLAGTPDAGLGQGGMLGAPGIWTSALYPSFRVYETRTQQNLAEAKKKQEEALTNLESALEGAILAQYEQKLVPISRSDLEPVAWSMLDASQFLFVCIRQQDWTKHRKDPNLRVYALLHEVDHPEKPVRGSDYMDFDLAAFDSPNAVTDSYPSDGKIVCESRNLTGRMLSPGSLADLQQVKDTFAKWQKELNDARKPSN